MKGRAPYLAVVERKLSTTKRITPSRFPSFVQLPKLSHLRRVCPAIHPRVIRGQTSKSPKFAEWSCVVLPGRVRVLRKRSWIRRVISFMNNKLPAQSHGRTEPTQRSERHPKCPECCRPITLITITIRQP